MFTVLPLMRYPILHMYSTTETLPLTGYYTLEKIRKMPQTRKSGSCCSAIDLRMCYLVFWLRITAQCVSDESMNKRMCLSFLGCASLGELANCFLMMLKALSCFGTHKPARLIFSADRSVIFSTDLYIDSMSWFKGAIAVE